MPSCSVMWAETLSRRICIRPDISPFWQTQRAQISICKSQICLQWLFFKLEFLNVPLQKTLYWHLILFVHHTSEIFISPLTKIPFTISLLYRIRAISNSKTPLPPYSEYIVHLLSLFSSYLFSLRQFLPPSFFSSFYLLLLFFTLPPLLISIILKAQPVWWPAEPSPDWCLWLPSAVYSRPSST